MASRRALLALGGLMAVTGCTPAAPAAPSPSPRPPGSSVTSSAATTATPGMPSASTPPSSPPPSSAPPSSPTKELPRGGTTVFPRYRLVGYCGYPGAPGQGRLGIGTLDDRAAEIEKKWAKPYAGGREVLPVLELIAVTVHASPGPDGLYRGRTSPSVIDDHLAAARRHTSLLLLNIQPGRARFLDEVKALEHWLAEPDVGVALDPEWAVKKGQVPGRVFGSTTGAELNEVAAWLGGLVTKHHLPEKVMVVHQLHPTIVTGESKLKSHPGVAMVRSVDGIGRPGAKIDTYRRIVERTPKDVHLGFKLFFSEDVDAGGPLMKPAEVLALKPQPEYVLYE